MRLDDLRRNVRDEEDIPAEVERELEILDAALRGEEVPAGWRASRRSSPTSAPSGRIPSPASRPSSTPGPPRASPAASARALALPAAARVRAPAASSPASAPDGPRGWAPVAATAAAVVVVGVSLSQVADFGDSDESLTGGPQAVEGEFASARGAPKSTEATAEELERDLDAVSRGTHRHLKDGSDLLGPDDAAGYNLWPREPSPEELRYRRRIRGTRALSTARAAQAPTAARRSAAWSATLSSPWRRRPTMSPT